MKVYENYSQLRICEVKKPISNEHFINYQFK